MSPNDTYAVVAAAYGSGNKEIDRSVVKREPKLPSAPIRNAIVHGLKAVAQGSRSVLVSWERISDPANIQVRQVFLV